MISKERITVRCPCGCLGLDELDQMEQSLAQIYKDNITLMTQSLEQYKNEMVVFQKKYDMLREDYQYNLRVIKERDDELRKCDNYVTKMNSVRVFSPKLIPQVISQLRASEKDLQNQVQAVSRVSPVFPVHR